MGSNGGRKGVKRARTDLLPVYPMWMRALVYGMGAEKYGAQNWRKGLKASAMFGAALRHIFLAMAGQWLDESESKLPHLAHAGWMLDGIVELYIQGTLEWDLPEYPPELIHEMVELATVTNPDDIFNEDITDTSESLLDATPYTPAYTPEEFERLNARGEGEGAGSLESYPAYEARMIRQYEWNRFLQDYVPVEPGTCPYARNCLGGPLKDGSCCNAPNVKFEDRGDLRGVRIGNCQCDVKGEEECVCP